MDTSYAVFCGIDVGKSEHHAVGLAVDGTRLYDKALPNDEGRLRAVFDRLATHGPLLIVVDQPNTIGALPVTVARSCGAATVHFGSRSGELGRMRCVDQAGVVFWQCAMIQTFSGGKGWIGLQVLGVGVQILCCVAVYPPGGCAVLVRHRSGGDSHLDGGTCRGLAV